MEQPPNTNGRRCCTRRPDGHVRLPHTVWHWRRCSSLVERGEIKIQERSLIFRRARLKFTSFKTGIRKAC